MTRLPRWRRRLEALTDELRRRPFDWSRQHDCALGLSARAVEALTGEDIAASWRGRYRSEKGALLALRKAGFDSVADAAASMLPEVAPSMAQEGDIAAVPDDGPFGFALGVFVGERVLVLRPDGLATVDRLTAGRAFRVG